MSTLNTYNLKSPDSANTNLALDASGNVAIQAGSASTPSVYVTGDANTGLYSPGADQLALSTGGTGRLFIDSSGRVGLGTSSPGYKLNVNGSGYVVGLDGGGTSRIAQLFQNTSGQLSLGLESSAGGALMTGATAYSSCIGSDNATSLHLGTNGTVRATIDSSGRLGVGTTSPGLTGANRTAVSINAPTGQLSILEFAINNTLTGYLYSNASLTTLNSQSTPLTFEVQGAERARIDTSGRFGIGTTSPSQPLHVNTSNASLLITGTTNTSGFQIGVREDGQDVQLVSNGSGGAMRFLTNPSGGATEVARIDSSGRLLVGTSSSLAVFKQQLSFDGGSTNGLLVSSSASSLDGSVGISVRRAYAPNNTNPAIELYDTATRFEVRNNGGIANYQSNNVNLSDRSAKKDISPAADTWNCIKQWEIVNYRYKEQPDDAELNLGVIAQQIGESCPEVITVFEKAKDSQPEKLGIKEQQMYWMAIKALQEAQVRIEALEASNADLLARLTAAGI